MIAFRPMVADDRQFVISGWSSSFRTSDYSGMISNANYARVMHAEIGLIINRPTTSIVVACEPGELDHQGREFLYGFIAVRTGGKPYVYYCSVKERFRERRIARRLFAAVGIDPRLAFRYAYRTRFVDDLASKIPEATHDAVSAKEEA